MPRLTRSCLPALLGLMLWFAAAVPAQAQYNNCPDLTNLPAGGVVWLDLSLGQCTNDEPGPTSDVIGIEYNSGAQTYRVGYFSAGPPSGSPFGTVVFAGIPLTDGFFSSSVSCPSGCSISGTYGGSPISATVSGTSVGPSAPGNTAPTADAGLDQAVASAASVTLDGSGSDANDAGQTLTYAWTETSGTGVSLTGATTG
ncbi:PKD domain-containing protein, partial [Roseovarius amoyensis]|uniref:PKD domain-containing protein n=1 Tax=Roseovarius amoyensis TaxID=2211448 RepID=UPI00195515F0